MTTERVKAMVKNGLVSLTVRNPISEKKLDIILEHSWKVGSAGFSNTTLMRTIEIAADEIERLERENAELQTEQDNNLQSLETALQNLVDEAQRVVCVENAKAWKDMRDDVLSLLITSSKARFENVRHAIDRHAPKEK